MNTLDRETARRAPIQKRSRDTVGAILEAAARVLVEEGGAAASTNRIAKVAGVSIGTLYQYFDSRESIVAALARGHARDMHALLTHHAATLGDLSPAIAVPAFVDAMAAAHAVAPRLHVVLVQQLLAEGPEMLEAVQAPGRALVRVWLERHRAAILPRDLDAAAFLLTTTVEAAIHAQIMDDPTRLSDPAWRGELIDLLLRYLGLDPRAVHA